MGETDFETVYREHSAPVYRYCLFSLGSREDAEDAATEVFARFLVHGDGLAPDRVAPWLFTVARNLCTSARRRQAVRARTQDAAGFSETEAPAWRDAEVWTYVARLGERARLVVFLHIAEDRTFRDVARLAGGSEPAAKMVFRRAMARLRRDMVREGFAFGPAKPIGSESNDGA